MKTDYLIIGSSAAGCGCVEGIRKFDKKGEITVVSTDDNIIYSRPVISEYLTDELIEDNIKYRDDKFIKKNNIKFLSNNSIERINTKDKIAYLKNKNESIKFEKCFIGVGAEPIIPSELKINSNHIFTFSNLTEVKRLKNALESYKNIVVVGAGFIGLEAAYALKKLNKKVTIIELADRILSRQSDIFLSSLIEIDVIKNGIDIILNSCIKKIYLDEKNDVLINVETNNNQIIKTDAVICCIGVRPSIKIADSSEIKYNKGIIVNEYLETNAENIYAGGDVVEIYDITIGKNNLLPLWGAAVEQGKIAGQNITGEKKIYRGTIPMSPLKFLNIPGLSCGAVSNDNMENILYKTIKPHFVYKKFFFENERMIGYILLNDLSNAGIYTKLIRNKFKIPSEIKRKINEDNFSLSDLPEDFIKDDYDL